MAEVVLLHSPLNYYKNNALNSITKLKNIYFLEGIIVWHYWIKSWVGVSFMNLGNLCEKYGESDIMDVDNIEWIV